jgi:4-amino-4-deoxy-L-arabinose transferase-like glycosyltransferase
LAGHFSIWHLLIIGLVVRLVILAMLPDQAFPDAGVYVETGRDLMTTGHMSSNIYMPLYPLWTWLWGGARGVKIGDIILSTAMIWLVWRLAEAIFDRRVAAIAAMATAIYPHFLFYAVSGLTETSFTFLLCSAFLAFYRRHYLLGSILVVLSILVRPVMDLIAPILVFIFVVVVQKGRLPEALWRVGQYCLVYLALMAPWWAHNYDRFGTFVRLNLGDGIVLYSGNNPLNYSGGGVIGGGKGSDVDLTPFNGIADPVARNAAMERAAWRFIRENPDRFLELAGVKFLRFWRLWPYASEYERPSIIVVSLLSYGTFLMLSLWFLITEGRRYARVILPMVALAVYVTLVHMITIGSIRYRFPLEPFLLILGSGALISISRHNQVLRRITRRLAP